MHCLHHLRSKNNSFSLFFPPKFFSHTKFTTFIFICKHIMKINCRFLRTKKAKTAFWVFAFYLFMVMIAAAA